MSRRNFSQPSLADAFVKANCRGGGFLEQIAKRFEWRRFDVLPRFARGFGRSASLFAADNVQDRVVAAMVRAVGPGRGRGCARSGVVPPLLRRPARRGDERSRQRIDKLGLSEKLLAEVNRQLDARGLIVKRGTLVAELGIENRIAYKAKRNKALANWQIWFNKTASSVRVGVERANATMKNGYGMARVRYRGLARNHSHLQFVAMAMNMKRARVLLGAA